MRMIAGSYLLVLVLLLSVIALIGSVVLEVNSAKVVKAAEFAVQELSKLSDSGIYETLELSKVLSADEIDGLFHINILLHLELRSPYFASHNLLEKYHMIVMRHKEDNITTLAIDDFPVMDEDAIEEFYIKRVEYRRKMREKAFEELELDAIAMLQEIERGEQSLLEEHERVLFGDDTLEAEVSPNSGRSEIDPEIRENPIVKELLKTYPKGESDDGDLDLGELDLQELNEVLKKLNSN